MCPCLFILCIFSIAAGILSEISSVLVLSGVSGMNDLSQFAYRPYIILDGVFQIPNDDTTNKVSDQQLEEAGRRVSTCLFSLS